MFENYTQLSTIKSGEGSYSSVYEVQDNETHKHYALKIIKGINTPLYEVVFEREVGALKKLRTCGSIVRMEHFDTYIDDQLGKCGRIFLEYLVGENLDNVDVVELSNQQKIQIIDKLINAVQSAHENNIIHRDINPKNIMRLSDGNIKLIDFGISKIKDMVNNETTFQFATNRYAAPEVINHNENATEQSDIYSLGAVFYYLFTGQQPPIADEFEEHLNAVSGIDIELKSILKNMIKKSTNDRYKNIFEVKKSILKVLKRFSKSNRAYVFSISNQVISHLKNISLLPRNVSNPVAIQENLSDEFLDGYMFITNESHDQTEYTLYGLHCSLECLYDEEQQVFKVAKAYKLMPNKREEYKKRGLAVNGEIKFIPSGWTKIPTNNNYELIISIRDHMENYLSSTNVNNEYTRKYSAWNKFLEIMEAEYKKKVLGIEYHSYKIEDDCVVFSISEEGFLALEDKEEDISFVYEEMNKAIKIGDRKIAFKNNDKFYLSVVRTNKRARPPQNGVIFEDYTKNMTLINRERTALATFRYEGYASMSNLKSIFSGIELASHFKSPKQIQIFNTNLDHAQRRAVEKALNSRDIALIQGPPGTGKTNVIIEILIQIFEINKQGKVFKQNVLLVSQSHAAVDKMLEDLAAASNEHQKVIRIGMEENLTDVVKERYAVDYAQSRWLKDVINKSNSYREKRLNVLGIDSSEFQQYASAILRLNSKDESTKNEEETNQILKEFEEKYAEQIKTKEFNWILIQLDWANRIHGRTDIQQHFIKNSVIISGTCTGVVSNTALHDMVFDYVIIDEAAKATFPEMLISINRAKRIIMVGDHKQLPPVLDDNLIENNKQTFLENNIDHSTLYESVFERLFEHLPPENKHVLSTQYRMHPTIGTMISEIFYDNEISNGVDKKDRSHSIEPYNDLAILWVDTSTSADRFEQVNGTSYCNSFEASLVKEQIKLVDKYLHDNKLEIGIITPYSAQKYTILKEIESINLANIDARIPVNTVDAFQGGQKDIIVYSTVRSLEKGRKIGHLKSKERLNVAFSRAKRLLIIVGDAKYLNYEKYDGNLFPKIIGYIKAHPIDCAIHDYKKLKEMM